MPHVWTSFDFKNRLFDVSWGVKFACEHSAPISHSMEGWNDHIDVVIEKMPILCYAFSTFGTKYQAQVSLIPRFKTYQFRCYVDSFASIVIVCMRKDTRTVVIPFQSFLGSPCSHQVCLQLAAWFVPISYSWYIEIFVIRTLCQIRLM